MPSYGVARKPAVIHTAAPNTGTQRRQPGEAECRQHVSSSGVTTLPLCHPMFLV
jgi:hypothetical protein